MNNSNDPLIKRLYYLSWHRGCKETDQILGKFADQFLEEMTDIELQQYAKLLDADDWDIFQWVTLQSTVKPQFNNPITQKLISFTRA